MAYSRDIDSMIPLPSKPGFSGPGPSVIQDSQILEFNLKIPDSSRLEPQCDMPLPWSGN